MSMTMGLMKAAVDDVNASLSGDFGSLRFTNQDDDTVEGIDVNVAAATSEEGTPNPSGASPDADAPAYAGGFSGTGGTSVSYTLPTLDGRPEQLRQQVQMVVQTLTAQVWVLHTQWLQVAHL